MRIKSALFAGAVALTALIGAAAPAVASIARPATVTPQAASPWINVYLHAFSGNGCASVARDVDLAPIISEPCSSSVSWTFRDLTRDSGVVQPNDQLEFVDFDRNFAIGYSGGLVKLETPDANNTIFTVRALNSSWQLLWVFDADEGMVPEAVSDDVGLQAAVSDPPDAWLECPLSTPECTTGVSL